MDTPIPRSIKPLLKRVVPAIPDSTAVRYTVAPPPVAPESQRLPGEDSNEAPLHTVLGTYEFFIPNVPSSTRSFAFGNMALGQRKLDRLTLFHVSRMFLCHILAGILKTPDLFIHTRKLSSWLAIRICVSLGAVRQPTFDAVGKLLREFSKQEIVQVITTYMSLQYVAVHKEPHEIFLSIIQQVCGGPQQEEKDDVIPLDDIGTYDWRHELANIKVQWIHGCPVLSDWVPDDPIKITAPDNQRGDSVSNWADNEGGESDEDGENDEQISKRNMARKRKAATQPAARKLTKMTTDLQATKPTLETLKKKLGVLDKQLDDIQALLEGNNGSASN